MNFNKFDKIILNEDDIQKLDDWWLHIHDGDSHFFPPVIKEGVIILNATHQMLDNPSLVAKDMRIYFKQLNSVEVNYEFYRTKLNGQVEKVMSATKNYDELKSQITLKMPNPMGITKDKVIPFLDSAVTPHIALMNYMAFYQERVSTERVRTVVQKKQSTGKKKTVKPVAYVLYHVSFPNEEVKVTDEEKREFGESQKSWIIDGQEWKVFSGTKGMGKAFLTEEGEKSE